MHELAAKTPQSGEPASVPLGAVGVMPFIVMMSSQAAQSMLFGLTPALLPAMARSFGAQGPFITQMVSALPSLGLMITSIASGQIVRAIGVRRLLILSALIFGLAGIVPAFTANVPVVLGSRVLAGAGCGLLTTGCAMLLAHCYSGTARSKAMGYQTGIGSVVGLVALIGAGAAVVSLGWHLPFLLYGVFALPVAILSIVGVPEVSLQAPVRGEGMARAFSRTWPICIAGCLLMMLPLAIGSNVPFILTSIGVTTPLVQSSVISGTTIMSAVGGALFGAVQARLGVRRTFATALLFAAVGMGCIGLATQGWMVGLGCALAGIAVGLYIPHLVVLSTTLVPEAMRGHSVGMLTTAFFLGGFLYPFLVGSLQKLLGLDGALQAVAIMLALGAAWALTARRARVTGFVAMKAA